MEPTRKVLIVDKSIDRKKRIAAVRQRGFSVFPALKLDEARSRCRPGAYDLIVVHGADEQEACVAFCDQMRERTPSQPVLLIIGNHGTRPDREYLVQDQPSTLADRVEAALHAGDSAKGVGHNREEEIPARVSA
jgi:DNA-binding NtrC family response regulator